MKNTKAIQAKNIDTAPMVFFSVEQLQNKQQNTVKPVLSGHPWGMLQCPLNTGCPLNRGIFRVNKGTDKFWEFCYCPCNKGYPLNMVSV